MKNAIHETAKETAKKIRKALKEVFPSIKFSVTSSFGSTTDSVSVKWTDGPLDEEVSMLLEHFESGHFDGMHDMLVPGAYYYDGSFYNGATFVQTSRSLSTERRALIDKCLEENFKFETYHFFTRPQYKAAEEMLRKNGDIPSYTIEIPSYLIQPSQQEQTQQLITTIDNVIPFPSMQQKFDLVDQFTPEQKMKHAILQTIIEHDKLQFLLKTSSIDEIFTQSANWIYGNELR